MLAEADPPVVKMADMAGSDPVGTEKAEAAEQPRRAHVGDDLLLDAQPILQDDDNRRPSHIPLHERRQKRRQGGIVGCLQAHEDDVDGRKVLRAGENRRRFQQHVSPRRLHPQAVGPQVVGIAAGEEVHRVAGGGESGSVVSADRTDPDDGIGASRHGHDRMAGQP